MKRIICTLAAAVMLLSNVSAALAEDAKTTLLNEITSTAVSYSATEDGDLYMYRDMKWSSIADTLPAKFDLRDRGVVPEIRDQGKWGTCWGFASIAAAETSILSTVGVTTQEYEERTGAPFDLSERHLAWFGTNHLPTLDQYPEGEYPYTESQAGEGLWHSNEDTEPNEAHYRNGGFMGYAAGIFANGMGPTTEERYPYAANDGSSSTAADWSIDESARHEEVGELVNSNILPSPSVRDAEGNYVYNAAGTEAIKKELLAGRAVSIAYHADKAMSEDAKLELYAKAFVEIGIGWEAAVVYARVYTGQASPFDLAEDEKALFLTAVLIHQGGYTADSITDEVIAQFMDKYDSIAQTLVEKLAANQESGEDETLTAEEEAKRRSAAEQLGRDYDAYMALSEKMAAAAAGVYINTETYAQYTDNAYAPQSHAVAIVGWDDDYAVENFPADHQPPASGAWIVRNSWGADYGNEGYFYLSYYDQTLMAPETFEYVFDTNAKEGGVWIESYDCMQARAVSSAQLESVMYSANVFKLQDECVLAYVSVMTADLNAKATVAVYLLNENYTSPVDGMLLDTVTADFEFGGYHRIALNHDYQLPAGAVISVVQKQATKTTDGLRYTLPFTNADSKEAKELSEIMMPSGKENPVLEWSVGLIGEGESYVCVDNCWYDWKDIVDEVQAGSSIAALVEFDNLNIKAYFYSVNGVNAAHSFGPAQSYMGEEALICEDCGDTVIIIR